MSTRCSKCNKICMKVHKNGLCDCCNAKLAFEKAEKKAQETGNNMLESDLMEINNANIEKLAVLPYANAIRDVALGDVIAYVDKTDESGNPIQYKSRHYTKEMLGSKECDLYTLIYISVKFQVSNLSADDFIKYCNDALQLVKKYKDDLYGIPTLFVLANKEEAERIKESNDAITICSKIVEDDGKELIIVRD